mgnify:CR=1 FL=1
MTELKGKVALVTGAAKGIGKAAAAKLAEEGVNIAVNYNSSKQEAEETVKYLKDLGIDSISCQADVGNLDQVTKMVDVVTDHFGQIDILVNSAGLNLPKRRYREMKMGDWQMVIDANLNGAYNCVHAVLSHMRDRGDGLIINVSSWAGRHDSYVAGPAYGASKYAMSLSLIHI